MPDAAGDYTNKLTFGTLPRTERGKPLVLSADPKGKTFLYTNNNSVIIRDLEKPELECEVVTQHACAVTVAKYSPSGFYIASADKSGKIRIWDTVNKEHLTKSEYQPISGPIYDLCWSQDNQRIVCVGEGREKFGHVFLSDTGTSNGDITGQTRPVNTCDFKPTRPFRIITGSEDNTSAVYEGPPFKFKTLKKEHQRYVQSVRYSPDGNFWASGGFDGRIFIYEAKDSELIGEFNDESVKGGNAHAGGVYAIAWSGDSKKILSASGDKTCKIWLVENRKVLTTFKMGDQIEDQQLGCLWSGKHLVSVSLSGNINYLDPDSPAKPSKVIRGHNKPITKMTSRGDTLVTAGSDGRVIEWNVQTGDSKAVVGEGHGHQVNGVETLTDAFASVGIDDTVRFFQNGSYVSGKSHKLGAQPKGIASSGDITAIATLKSLIIMKNDAVVTEENLDFESSCVAISPDGGSLAVGDSAGMAVHIYQVSADGAGVTQNTKVTLSGSPSDCAYSPDGKYFVTADSNRKVTLFNAGDYSKAVQREWGFHSAKVNCVAFSPDSLFVCSGGLDCSLIVWSVKTPDVHMTLPSAHVQSQITGVKWIDNTTVASCGQDSNVKIWDINWKN